MPELYLHNLTRGTSRRLPLDREVFGFTWHPDSQQLAVSVRSEESGDLLLVNLNGEVQTLVSVDSPDRVLQGTWLPDGREYIYTVQRGTPHEIWVLSLDAEPARQLHIGGPSAKNSPALSPDGQWLLYCSYDSGRAEIYLQQYLAGAQHLVSVNGGASPLWHPDGRTLFFTGVTDEGRTLMSVSLQETNGTLELGSPTPLFPLQVAGPTGIVASYRSGANTGTDFDIFPDGRHFLMVRGPHLGGAREIVVVQNWFSELNKICPLTETN